MHISLQEKIVISLFFLLKTNKRKNVDQNIFRWIHFQCIADPRGACEVNSCCPGREAHCYFLLQLWQVFVLQFFTMLGYTVTELPLRSVQKPPASTKLSVPNQKSSTGTETLRNKPCVREAAGTHGSGGSEQLFILQENCLIFSFLWNFLQTNHLFCWFHWIFAALHCPIKAGLIIVFELWGGLTAARFLHDDVTLWCFDIWKSDQSDRGT